MLVAGAILYTAFVWWFATGLVMCLARRPEDWHGTLLLTLAMPTALAALAIVAVAQETSVAGALLGFTSAVMLWGWFETSFLFGHLTGPRRAPCPPGVGNWRRFRLAFAVLRDHELALFGVLGLLVLGLWDAPNRVALDTFTALWACRLASKLCLFVGVPTVTQDMLPQRMRYLTSYFGRGRPGLVYGLAVGALAFAAWTLLRGALVGETAFAAVGGALVGGLVALAVLEHALMALPVRDSRLWDWAVRVHGKGAQDAGTQTRSGVRGRELKGVALRHRAVVPAERDA